MGYCLFEVEKESAGISCRRSEHSRVFGNRKIRDVVNHFIKLENNTLSHLVNSFNIVRILVEIEEGEISEWMGVEMRQGECKMLSREDSVIASRKRPRR